MYKAFRKIFLLIAASPLLIVGCAGSAAHKVQTANTAYDNELTCEELRQEIIESQAIIDGVNKDKEDISGADIVDGILYFPFNLAAKHANYNKALEAADKRIATCNQLLEKKGCEEANLVYLQQSQTEPETTIEINTSQSKENQPKEKELKEEKAISNEELFNEIKRLNLQLAKLEGSKIKKEVARLGNFIAYDDGTVLDKNNNLIWWSKCIHVGNSYYKAVNNVKEFSGGGYTDWRLPTINELKTIYFKGSNSKFRVIKLITITTPFLVSNDIDYSSDAGPQAKYINFVVGSEGQYLADYDNFAPGELAYLPVRNAE